MKNPIIGYNNKLRVANNDVKFGSNSNINYFVSTHNQPKKVHQDVPSNHLETIDEKPELKFLKTKTQLDTFEEQKKKKKTNIQY